MHEKNDAIGSMADAANTKGRQTQRGRLKGLLSAAVLVLRFEK
jgi:hypothetical protein